MNPLASARFIPYPRALKQLADRLNASPDELAAWVWIGPDNGGLAAYLNANELKPPPRFYYDYLGEGQGFDYLEPLMRCWFQASKIAKFKPIDRFITGKALIERWGKHPGIQPEVFIRAKITESRLLDIHPIVGGTQGSSPEDTALPPIENGLFVLSHVEEIEASDLGSDKIDRSNFVKPLNTQINALPKGEFTIKKKRIDAMSAEIEKAILELGKQATPYEIMQNLQNRAQTGGCITEATPNGVLWLNESGEPSKLDMKMLRKRLARRTQMLKIPR